MGATRVLSMVLMVAMAGAALAAPHPSSQTAYDRACGKFFERAEQLEGGLSKKTIFADSQLAHLEMHLADQYPIYPDAQSAILKKVIAAKGDRPEILELNSVKPACDPARYYAWARRLIKSADLYKFSVSDKNELASVLMTRLRSDATEPRPFMVQLLDLKLLQYAHERGVLKLSKRQAEKLREKNRRVKTLSQRSLAREAEIEKLSAQVGEPTDSAVEIERQQKLAGLRLEQLASSEELRAMLGEILEFSNAEAK